LVAAGIRVTLDEREGVTPGFKFNDWEMRGVPLRIEIGPKDVAKNSVALARRDRPGREGKSFIPREGLAAAVSAALDEVQKALLERATQFRKANTHDPKNYDEFRNAIENGWAFSFWCGSADCEARIKEETKATIRNIPIEQPGGNGPCIACGGPSQERAIFGRAY
ncbi:MAG TPA: His/Gly/Thr/Pro-type tRNA ligase C-terminal domain-containing protein, partial [Candidatus Acidoferrales bacterium]|nr:His/Gly/Thr/Pro-type tRNA ligase C-terminal domain-containing protein [Candidatus Acidoferrales bacterium]